MSEKKWLPILKNLEFTLEQTTLSDAQWKAIAPQENSFASAEFASFMFSDLNFHCFQQDCSTSSAKVKHLDQVLTAYQSCDQRFASINILHNRTSASMYQLQVSINQNFLRSLKDISSVIRFGLQWNQEEKIGDSWVQWGSEHNVEPLTVNIKKLQETYSDVAVFTSHSWATIYNPQEIKLLCAGNSNIRLKFKLDVFLGVSEDLKNFFLPLRLSKSSILDNLRNNHSIKDFAIVAAEGDKISCHGILLSAQSPVLEAMMSSQMQEGETRVVKMDDIGNEALTHFIDFFYGVEIPSEISCEVALQLFQAGHKYEIKHLEEAMASFFLYKEESWFSVNASMELFCFVKKLEEYFDLNKRICSIITRATSS